ncbi:carboxymethylenebutenolidase [Alsobacter metallidurans]|uniref:Carboxymethylenebutenolidase n=1 Tax=Alsobacter metallidurans TaxID=340221 RepID=A0A917IBA5_9HYPH|nr:dienelactone hydrolase family protein [Alsobacter metallidurans]GGH31492.1 carboxymethylenebutenolidase [Alsobacter metallidurans]
MALDRRIIELYDEYTHKPLARRTFLERLSALAGSSAAASAALVALEPNYAHAALVPETDPRIVAERVRTKVAGVEIAGYLARPNDDAKHPAVIVLHENRGLNAHIEDVARRLAAAGFLALAGDFLLPLGGTPSDADAARDLFSKLTGESVVSQAGAMLTFLRDHPNGGGKVGAVGFCWGGGMVNILAIREPRLGAGVAFYGVAPPSEAVARIKAPMMLHYAGLDARVNAGIPGYDAALKEAGVPHTIYVYEGVNHAFHNDTSAERYNQEAATLAFDRTVSFFKEKLAS